MHLKVTCGIQTWFVSCVYGHPVVMKLRPYVWERITRIGVCRKDAWCMIGDFNDIISNKNNLGGPLRRDYTFRTMLENCDMSDLGSTCNSFTWTGTRNKQRIHCKLDRCVGNSTLFLMFPNSHQWFLEKLGSDHKPIWSNSHVSMICFVENSASINVGLRIRSCITSRAANSMMVRIANYRREISSWKKEI